MQKLRSRPFIEDRISIGRFSHMTEDDKKLFGCLTCGFRVSGKIDTCPRCGVRFGRETMFECPFCGESVERDTTVCPSCNIEYAGFVAKAEENVTEESIDGLLTEIIEIEAKKVKEEAKKLSCPTCSWMVGQSEENCPKCGNVFAENVTYMCPVCAAMLHFEADKCEECGSLFVDEEKDIGEQDLEEQAPEGPASAEEAVAVEEPPAAPAPEPQPESEAVEPTPIPVIEEIPEPVAEEPVPEEAPTPKVEPVAEAAEEPAPETPVPAEPVAEEAPEEEKKEVIAPVKRVRRRKLKAKPKR